MQASTRRPIAAVSTLLLVLGQAGCFTSPRPVTNPGPMLQSDPPKRIWVSLASGTEMVIDGPKVYGDSLLGFTQKNGESEEVWLPLSDLQEVRTRHFSGTRTALLGGAFAAAAALLVLSIPTDGGEVADRCFNEGVPCEDA